jgi:hypothetical protein
LVALGTWLFWVNAVAWDYRPANTSQWLGVFVGKVALAALAAWLAYRGAKPSRRQRNQSTLPAQN